MSEYDADFVRQLERLTSLYEAGNLDDAEFRRAKDRLIHGESRSGEPRTHRGAVGAFFDSNDGDGSERAPGWVLVLGGGLVALGAFFGPWATAFGAFTVGGGSGDGPFLGIAGLLLIGAGLSGRARRSAILLAVACAVYALWLIARIISGGGDDGLFVEVGWGAYAMLIGGVIGAYGAFRLPPTDKAAASRSARSSRSAGDEAHTDKFTESDPVAPSRRRPSETSAPMWVPLLGDPFKKVPRRVALPLGLFGIAVIAMSAVVVIQLIRPPERDRPTLLPPARSNVIAAPTAESAATSRPLPAATPAAEAGARPQPTARPRPTATPTPAPVTWTWSCTDARGDVEWYDGGALGIPGLDLVSATITLNSIQGFEAIITTAGSPAAAAPLSGDAAHWWVVIGTKQDVYDGVYSDAIVNLSNNDGSHRVDTGETTSSPPLRHSFADDRVILRRSSRDIPATLWNSPELYATVITQNSRTSTFQTLAEESCGAFNDTWGGTPMTRISGQPPNTNVGSTRSARLIAEPVNLRSGPGLSFPPIELLDNVLGSPVVAAAGHTNGWYQITIDDTTGWTFGAFVSPPASGHRIAEHLDGPGHILDLVTVGGVSVAPNPTGHLALVTSTSGPRRQVLLPSGATAYVNASEIRLRDDAFSSLAGEFDRAEALRESERSLVTSAVSHPASDRVQELFVDYFAGINNKDYDRALRRLGPGLATRAGFIDGVDTTQDSNIVIHSINATRTGNLSAVVTFTSTQSAADGPNGWTCANWQLTYELDMSGFAVITKASNAAGSPSRC